MKNFKALTLLAISGVVAISTALLDSKIIDLNALNLKNLNNVSDYSMHFSKENKITEKEASDGLLKRPTNQGNLVYFYCKDVDRNTPYWNDFIFNGGSEETCFGNKNAISGLSSITVNAQLDNLTGYTIKYWTTNKDECLSINYINASGDWIESDVRTFDFDVPANYFEISVDIRGTSKNVLFLSLDLHYQCNPAQDAPLQNAIEENKGDLVAHPIYNPYLLGNRMLYGNNSIDGRKGVLEISNGGCGVAWPHFTLDLGKSLDLTKETLSFDCKSVAQPDPFVSVYALYDSNFNKLGYAETSIGATYNTWVSYDVIANFSDVRYIELCIDRNSTEDIRYFDNFHLKRGVNIKNSAFYPGDVPLTTTNPTYSFDVKFDTNDADHYVRLLLHDSNGNTTNQVNLYSNGILQSTTDWSYYPAGYTSKMTADGYWRITVNPSEIPSTDKTGELTNIHCIEMPSWGINATGLIDYKPYRGVSFIQQEQISLHPVPIENLTHQTYSFDIHFDSKSNDNYTALAFGNAYNYFGYYYFYPDGHVMDGNGVVPAHGITSETLDDGYIRFTLHFDDLDVLTDPSSPAPTTFTTIYGQNWRETASGYIDYNLPSRGIYFALKSEITIYPTPVLQVEHNQFTFDIRFMSTGSIQLVFGNLAWSHYFGYYIFYSDGRVENSGQSGVVDEGIEVKFLDDGYIRYTLNFDNLTKVDGAGAPSEFGLIYSLASLTNANVYIDVNISDNSASNPFKSDIY